VPGQVLRAPRPLCHFVDPEADVLRCSGGAARIEGGLRGTGGCLTL
jgi:hypothetical protein